MSQIAGLESLMSFWKIKEALNATLDSRKDNILVEHKRISKRETKKYIFDRYKPQNLDRLQKYQR